ncbi:hypothetical protein GALMADRAFT_877952 [Galerina marginata CBS 339.88]|uniref:Uncharacterized protein n=1 Tax=Galerina marginata (strain CBS 339.88) TaxID=685588 RepID=A0A067SI29_GALM3|nr:hypothetical protein GALMADRAFT_877952 [Galerina marginata CBS 339.88]
MAYQCSSSALSCSFADADQPSLMHSNWTFPIQNSPTATAPSSISDEFNRAVPPNSRNPVATNPSTAKDSRVKISLSTLQLVIEGYEYILCQWNNCGAIIPNKDNNFPEHIVRHHKVPTHSRSTTSTTPCFWNGCAGQNRNVADNLRSILVHIADFHLKMDLVVCPLCDKMLESSAFKFHARADHPEVEVVS